MFRRFFSLKCCLFILFCFYSAYLTAEEAPNLESETAADPVEAPDLEDETASHPTDAASENKPIDISLTYIGDGLYGFTGPFDNQATKMENLLLNLTLDGEQLYQLKGNSIFVSYIGIWGSNPSQVLQSPQWVDNIESPYQTARLFQAWVDQKFFSEKLSVLFGLYDFNSEFAVTDSSLVFIMPAMGTPTEIAQTGRNGPSIYPTSSLAGRFKITPNDHWYMMAAVFDGVPGNPNRPYGTHIDLVKSNGLFWAFENGVNFGSENKKYKLAMGGWFYTNVTDQLTGALPPKRNHGLYWMLDIPVYRVSEDSDRGVNLFFRPGIAYSPISMFSPAIGGGLYWKGPFEKRQSDETGIAFSYAQSTPEFIEANVSG